MGSIRVLSVPFVLFICFGLALSLSLLPSAEAAPPGSFDTGEAFYLFQRPATGGPPETESLRLTVTGTETVEGKDYVWWEFTVGTPEGDSFGVRALSERAPLTSLDGIGNVERYLYTDASGNTTEYRDQATGKALLPSLSFREAFLPRAAHDARYRDGFATAGSMLGHVLIRVHAVPGLQPVAFDDPLVLPLRTDLVMGYRGSACYDRDNSRPEGERLSERECTREEKQNLIQAGINLLQVREPEDEWLYNEPVYFRGEPRYPDWFYRSNWYPGRMYIDEPTVRFGWNSHIPRWDLHGEQFGVTLRNRVARDYVSRSRNVPLDGNTGNLDLSYENYVSWDTCYYAAWQTLAAGAPALVYEGRYVDNGYGWHPDMHFGDAGLEGLTFDQQLDTFHAFLRGAARAFDGHWGTSVYHEGDPELFEEAFIRAYDDGAKYLWFWIHQQEEGPSINYDTLIWLGNVIREHSAQNPRPPLEELRAKAQVGIVLPAGFVYTPGGIRETNNNAAPAGGATYGEISAAALWEGILLSRQGISYDYLNDEPRILDLGYERLLYVREDGTLDVVPPWEEPREPAGLQLALEPSDATPIRARQGIATNYNVPRASGFSIDGDLDDWDDVPWFDLGDDVRTELVRTELTVENVRGATGVHEIGREYLGFVWEQLNTQHQLEYGLEDYYVLGDRWIPPEPGILEDKQGTVVVSVTPGSPAEKGGLRPGDVIDRLEGHRTPYHFIIHSRLIASTDKDRLHFQITRASDAYKGPMDLSARAAVALDEDNLYVAVAVNDDVHWQEYIGEESWVGDGIQLGFDTTLGRGDNGYLENDHEIRLLYVDGKAILHRSKGRTGQHRGPITGARCSVRRGGAVTVYEAAIPREAILPFAPDMWPKMGFNIVVNDNDGKDFRKRESRLELREGAMTRGHNGNRFAVLEFEPPVEESASAALFWHQRATNDGTFTLLLATGIPREQSAHAVVLLRSLDSPQTRPLVERMPLDPSAPGTEQQLVVTTDSPPGRYELDVLIEDGNGRIITRDRQPIFVYGPETREN